MIAAPASETPLQALRRHIREMTRSCPAKRSYGCETAVRSAARYAIQSGRQNCPARLWVYPCASCRGWHMTKRANRDPAVTAGQMREGIA